MMFSRLHAFSTLINSWLSNKLKLVSNSALDKQLH